MVQTGFVLVLFSKITVGWSTKLLRIHNITINFSVLCQGIGGDSLVGSSVQVAEKASIKRSTVGHHCTIGDKTRVINSILMDYVTLGEG